MSRRITRRQFLDLSGRTAAAASLIAVSPGSVRAESMSPAGPELLILRPENESLARPLAARMVEQGVWFAFEDPSRLPAELPQNLQSFRMIVVPAEQAAKLEARVAAFRERGGVVATADAKQWVNDRFIERIALRGGLTLGHPGMARRMEQVSLLAVIETLLELPGEHPERGRLVSIARQMADSFVRFQDPNGCWHQVLDEPVRPEPTVTAWTTAALAKMIRHRLVERRLQGAIEKGWRAVKRQTWDGRPVAICAATTASADPDYYRFMVFGRPSPFAHFPLSATIEVMLLAADQARTTDDKK